MEFWEKPEYYCPKRDKCKHGKICDNRGFFRGEYLCFERAYDCYSAAIESFRGIKLTGGGVLEAEDPLMNYNRRVNEMGG